MNAMVSIVVPVYNAEKTLKECVKSIQEQTYKNTEIILVDDGSKDHSLEICHELSKEDSRIKVIHKENGGVSTARNAGIKAATGKYIQFVDSDDIVISNMTETMVSNMEKEQADFVVSSYITERWGKEKKHICPNRVYNDPKEMRNDFDVLYLDCFLNSPWNKMFCREKIVDLYDESMSYFEDYVFNLKYMANIKKIVTIDKCLYKYTEDSNGSLTKKYRKNLREIYLKVYNEQIKFCHKNFGKDFDHYLNYSLILGMYMSLQKLVYFSEENTKQKIAEINTWFSDKTIVQAIRRDIFKNRTLSETWQTRVFYIFAKYKISGAVYLWFAVKQQLNKIRMSMKEKKRKGK